MKTDNAISRRNLLRLASVSGATVLLAGCLGDDDQSDDADDSDDSDSDSDDDDNGDDDAATIPESLPTTPTEDDYVDRTNMATVEVVTREGSDDEPDYVFDPPFIAVDPGTTIRWVNEDDAFHTVTSITDLGTREGGGDIFDAEIAEEGETFEWLAEEPAIHHYYCLPHTDFMWGSIAILDGGSFSDAPSDDDPADDDPDDDLDYEDYTDVPEELPTSPTDDDFIDETGETEVEIFTRRGRDGEPNFVFDPPFVRVDQDTTVRWVNRDSIFHTVTSTDSLDSRSGGGEEFNATISSDGDEFAWEAVEEGRQDYYCSPHAGFMYGSIDIV